MEAWKDAALAVSTGTAKTVESAGKIVGIAGNIAVTGAETVKVGANTIKTGTETIKAGTETIKAGAETATEVAKAVKNKAGNITKVGLNTGQKTLEIASKTTGTIAALFGTIENKVKRYEANTKNKTIITQRALNMTQNSRAKFLANQQFRASSVQNKKSETNMIRKIKNEKNKQKKVFEDSIKVIEKLLNSTLLKLESLKDIVCNNKSVTRYIVGSKCKYLLENFDKQNYKLIIDNYINSYKGYFESLIVLLDTRLENYIYSNNINKSKTEWDEIKKKITDESYELSAFFEGIKQSIINIFLNIVISKRKNLNAQEKVELGKIFNNMKDDINKRKGVKNFRKVNNKPKTNSNSQTRINNTITQYKTNNTITQTKTNSNSQTRINNTITQSKTNSNSQTRINNTITQSKTNSNSQTRINNTITQSKTNSNSQNRINNPIKGAGKNNKKLKKNK
jgi:hypothetical protein